jgi:hypothetical protein
MIFRRTQHARDDAALLGHPHAFGGALGFYVGRFGHVRSLLIVAGIA